MRLTRRPRALCQVSSENPLAPRSKRPATLQLDDEPSGSDMNAASQMGTPLRGVATNQLPVEQEEDDEMLQLAAEESEPRSCPSTPVSSPQTDQQPSPTLFSAAAAENTPRPTAVQPMICTICQYSFPDMPGSTPLLRLLRCGHYFCKQHITSWFDTGRSVCPNCQCTYPSLRGRSRELSVHQLVQEEAAARRKAEFTAGDDVKAVWESDGKFYPATVVSVGEETLTVRWKDESEVDRTIRFDQVIKDSLASAGAEDQEGEVEITIKDKESGELYQATAHAMPDGLFSVCYTGAGQIRCSEKLTSAQLSRRSKDFSVCMVCGGCHSVSRSLLCDGCDSMCHLECADPPLQVVPAGKWFCNRALCRRKNAGAVRRGESADTQIASSPRSTPPAKHIAAVDTQNASNAVAKTSPKNRSRVKRIRTSFQVTNSADRANVMHTGPGDLYHVHFLGWNSRYDEAWTKAMCSEQLQDWVDDAPETCSVCGESGVLLVCDGCEAAFHLACLRPQLDHVPDGEWYCPSRACQLRPTFEKYCAEFETLARLQAAADRRFIFAGGTIADLCERLARDDLKLPPSSPLEEAHAAYPIKTRVEVNFSSGWYRGWVERHTDKSVGVRFDEDDDYYTVPLLEKPQKQGGKPAAKQCTWLLRSLEFDVEGVVKQTLSLMVDEIEDTMRNQPMIEILADILKLVMAHGKALDLSVLTQQLLQQDQSARNLAASLESIDLQTVKRNLDSGLYTTPDEFASDMMRCLASYHTKYLAHTPIVMCADALGRCFKRLMYSFGLKKVYQDAACKQKSQKPAQRISLRSPVPRAKHNSGEPVADQQLMKDRDALLKNIKPLGKHICAQVERCLDAPTTVDDSDRVALGAKLLRGNGELIEEFTEILLRGKQRQPAVSDQKQTRKKRATFCPEADRCIEYSTDVTRGLQAQLVLRADAIGECGVADGYSAQSGRCANAAISGCPEAGPRRRVSSTSISFRPSQVAGWSPQLSRDHRRAPSITGPRQLAGRQHKVIRITESKEQVPTIGMGLSQQYCTRDAGKETAMGPLVVTQCPAGTVAFNAGVRVGMELLSFESTPQKLAIGQGDFTFVGVMEMMRASDRPVSQPSTFLMRAGAT